AIVAARIAHCGGQRDLVDRSVGAHQRRLPVRHLGEELAYRSGKHRVLACLGIGVGDAAGEIEALEEVGLLDGQLYTACAGPVDILDESGGSGAAIDRTQLRDQRMLDGFVEEGETD